MAAGLLLLLAAAVGAAVPAGDPYELPAGSVVERLVEGPGGSVVAFYFEPLPRDLLCGVGLDEMLRDLRRVAAFDAEGARLWSGRVPALLVIIEVYLQSDAAVVIWGISDFRRGGVLRDAILMRIDAHGFDPSFQPLRWSELGGAPTSGQTLMGVAMTSDGGFDVTGSFTSVRGQPRPGKARLRPDGSLDD